MARELKPALRRLKDLIAAASVLVFAAYLYTALYSHAREARQAEGFREFTFRGRELPGGKGEYASFSVTLYAHPDGRYAVYTTRGTKTAKMYYTGQRLIREEEGRVVALEPGLHPRDSLFDTSFGSFLLENIGDFPEVREFPDQDIKGFVCRHVVVGDPLARDTEYEAWVDRLEGVPVKVSRRVSGLEVESYELVSVRDGVASPLELLGDYADRRFAEAEKPDERFRVDASALEARAGFPIFVPDAIPSDMRSLGYFAVPLKAAERELVGSSRTGEVVVISYASGSRFLQLIEYRGSPKKVDERRALKEVVGTRVGLVVPRASCWWAQFTVGDVVVNLYGTVTLDEARAIVREGLASK